MTEIEFSGWFIVVGLALISGLIGIITPLIKLSTNIQKLTDSINRLFDESTETKTSLKAHTETLSDHETRITVLEKQKEKK